MRINRSYALAASAWLVLVVVGAVLVWAVISRAGQNVVSQPGAPIGAASPITSPPETKRSQGPDSKKPPKKHPSRHASAGPSGGPSAGPRDPGSPSSTSGTPSSGPTAPAPTAGSAPGPAPGPGPTAGSGSSPSPSSPPPASSPPPPKSTQDSGVRRTWQGSAGAVTVECRGPSISLKGAQPNSGWSIEIERRGPEEVRVDFENDESRTRVQAECVGGTPRFEVDSED
jgi:hypothetical protein